MELDRVLDCAVVFVDAGDSASRIGCAYIPEEGEPLRTGHLGEALAGRLARQDIPELWLVVDDLPVDHLGTIDRRLIAKMFGGSTAVEPGTARAASLAGRRRA